MDEIERVSELSVTEFNQRFLAKGKPIIIERALSHWKAVQEWTVAGLADKLGDLSAPIKYPAREDSPPPGTRELPLREFLGDVIAAQGSSPEQRYLFDYRILAGNRPLNPVGEILQPDLGDIPYIPQNYYGNTSLFVGDDVETELHYHHKSEAFLLVVSGRKSVVMIDPRDTRRLDMPAHSLFNSSTTQFKHANRAFFRVCDESWTRRVDLEPGEMLYIPLHWWHYVFSRQQHISLTYWFRAEWRHWKWTPALAPSLLEVALAKRPLRLGLYSRLRQLASRPWSTARSR